MADARFGRRSDVYVYEDTQGGFTCERCPEVGQQFRCATAAEMVARLREHRAMGHSVPDDALEELEQESRVSDTDRQPASGKSRKAKKCSPPPGVTTVHKGSPENPQAVSSPGPG